MSEPLIDAQKLKVALVQNRRTLVTLAFELGENPSTLSAWIRRVNRQPPDLAARIETALGLPRGALIEDEAGTSVP